MADVASPESLLALYEKENWERPIPKLDPKELAVLREFFETHGMVMVAGYDSLQDVPMIRSTIGEDLMGAFDRVPDATVGPYVLGETYSVRGIGLWHPKSLVPPERVEYLPKQ